MCKVHPKLTQVIVEQTPRVMVAMVIIASIYFYIFLAYVPLLFLFLWLLVQIMIAAYRFYNAKLLQKYLDEKDEKAVEKNVFRFLLSNILQAIMWTLASFFAVVYAPQPYELVTFVMVVGVVTAALLVMSAIYKAYLIYFMLMMLPQLGILYYYGEGQHMGLLYFTLAYIPSIIILSKALHESRLEAIIANDALQKNVNRLHELSITDTLTSLYNRRYFFEVAQNLLLVTQREESNISLLMLDIDHFKVINDTYGHQAGDFILVSISKEIKELMRESDIFARIGGEEFTILLHKTSRDGAKVIAEKIRKRVAEKNFVFKGNSIEVTISIGISSLDAKNKYIDELYKEADKKLYEAKESGRNRVC